MSSAIRATRVDEPVEVAAIAFIFSAKAAFTRPSRTAASAGQARRQRRQSGEIREHQDADVVAVLAGDDDVLRQRLEAVEKGDAQRPDADPGAGGELEILCDAAVEHEAGRPVARLRELQSVADLVETFVVEGSRVEFGMAPIAWRDVGAAQPRLELRAVRNELQFDAAMRHADQPRPRDAAHVDDGARPRLGRAERGRPRQRPPGLALRQFAIAVEHRLRQSGAGVEQQPRPREEGFLQFGVGLQVGQQLLEPFGTLEKIVGAISRRFFTVVAMPAGVGLPSSM